MSSLQLTGFLFLVLVTFGTMAYVIAGQLLQKPLPRSVLAVIAIFLGGILAPYYWDTYYYKMWLLPLAAFAVMLGRMFAIHRWLCWLATGMSLVIFLWNYFAIYERNHNRDNPQSRAVAKLEQSLRPADLLVCDGWDHSGAFRAKNPRQPVLLLLDNSEHNQRRLTETLFSTWKQGGSVFFFNILERDRRQWSLSIQKFGHWEYDTFQEYRRASRLVWPGKDHGFEGNLFLLPPPD